MTITADRLLEGVKRRISTPTSQVLMTDADILAIADDITKTYMVPLLMSLNQDYFVTSSEVAFVTDQAEYDIPYRAVGRALRDLKIVDSSDTVRDVSLIPIEDAHRFTQSSTPHSFYFKGDQVVIVPTPSETTTSIQFWWEEPPSNLVKVDAAGLITAIVSPVVTVATLPSTMIAGVDVDFVKGRSGNSTIGMDKDIVSVLGTDITFASADIPSRLAVGDYVTLAQTTPVVQLPNECYPLLESYVGRRVLLAVGDTDGARAMDEDVRVEDKNLKLMLEPRIQGEPTVIINRNGLLRGRGFFARRGGILF